MLDVFSESISKLYSGKLSLNKLTKSDANFETAVDSTVIDNDTGSPNNSSALVPVYLPLILWTVNV